MLLLRKGLAAGLGLAAVIGIGVHPGAADPPSQMSFAPPIKLAGADGDSEPRMTVAPDGTRYVISNSNGPAVVYGSTDGLRWQLRGTLASQTAGTIDTDIVATRTGRLIANELDSGGINFRTSFSDDGGRTWTPVAGPLGLNTPFTGTGYVDQDRNWLAVGPDDPNTHLPRVYVLMHNLASGAVTHNMWVATSVDNGASFGPYIPVTLPGDQAWTDLQCADSGGPSGLFTNPRTGRVYAVWGARSSLVGGGCGASVTGTFEINVVAATRVWIASAPASGTTDPTQWSQSLAVDDNATGQIVGMQLSPGAIDSGDNVYVVYPESLHAYPDYTGAAIKYVHATEQEITNNPYGLLGPSSNIWSKPVTVAPAGQPGNVLAHMVAGDTGKVDFAWFAGSNDKGPGCGNNGKDSLPPPCWYPTAAQTLNALSSNPTITTTKLAQFPAYANADASAMMGACNTTPPISYTNGFTCTRSTDVWGITIDKAGHLLVAWPGDGGEFNGKWSGTYVSTQVAGPSITGGASSSVQGASTGGGAPPVATQGNLPNTSGYPASPGGLLVLLALALAVTLLAVVVRSRSRTT